MTRVLTQPEFMRFASPPPFDSQAGHWAAAGPAALAPPEGMTIAPLQIDSPAAAPLLGPMADAQAGPLVALRAVHPEPP